MHIHFYQLNYFYHLDYMYFYKYLYFFLVCDLSYLILRMYL